MKNDNLSHENRALGGLYRLSGTTLRDLVYHREGYHLVRSLTREGVVCRGFRYHDVHLCSLLWQELFPLWLRRNRRRSPAHLSPMIRIELVAFRGDPSLIVVPIPDGGYIAIPWAQNAALGNDTAGAEARPLLQ